MWHAKPSGAYGLTSTEALENCDEIRNLLASSWTLEAISGMLGNMFAESGLNPWRWQDDIVSLTSRTKGYGLAQFTPAYGYINVYGRGVEGFSPNVSTTQIQGGSLTDAQAQIYVIDTDRAGKFIDRRSYCTYWDLSNTYPFNSYKQLTDLYTATVGWLFNYEFPSAEYRTKSKADERYSYALVIYEYLGGHPPTPPIPTLNRYGVYREVIRRLILHR